MSDVRPGPTLDAALTLGQRSFRAVLWTLGAQSIGFAAQLATLAVLGRLLDEAEMGLVALTMIFLNLAVLLGGAGLSRALVQRGCPTPVEEATACWAGLAWAVTTWAVHAAVALPLATFFGDARLVPLIALSGAMAVPAAIWPLAAARLERELRFREIGLVELYANALPQAAITIVLAALGSGAWAVVIGALAGRSLQALVLTTLSRWRPAVSFCWSSLRSLASFGAWTAGAGFAVFATTNVDYVVAGRVLGPAALGLYAVAYQVAALPRSRIVAAVALVAFPSLASLRHDPERMGRAWARITGWVGYVVFPLATVLFVLAEPVLAVLFGERWLPAAPALRVLCPAGALMALRATGGSAINAAGRPSLGFASNLAVLALAVPILALAAPWGLEALAWGVVAMAVIDFLPLHVALVRLLGVDARELAVALARPALLSVAAGALTWIAVEPLADRPVLALACGALGFAASYTALVVTFARSQVLDVRRLLALPAR